MMGKRTFEYTNHWVCFGLYKEGDKIVLTCDVRVESLAFRERNRKHYTFPKGTVGTIIECQEASSRLSGDGYLASYAIEIDNDTIIDHIPDSAFNLVGGKG